MAYHFSQIEMIASQSYWPSLSAQFVEFSLASYMGCDLSVVCYLLLCHCWLDFSSPDCAIVCRGQKISSALVTKGLCISEQAPEEDFLNGHIKVPWVACYHAYHLFPTFCSTLGFYSCSTANPM